MSEEQGMEEVTEVEVVEVAHELPEDFDHDEPAVSFEEDEGGGDPQSTDEGDPEVIDTSPAEEPHDPAEHSEDA